MCDDNGGQKYCYRFTTYQDARRVRLVDGLETNILRVSPVKNIVNIRYEIGWTVKLFSGQIAIVVLGILPQAGDYCILGRAQPVIPPNLYYLMLMNIIAWGPQVSRRMCKILKKMKRCYFLIFGKRLYIS